MLKEESSKPVRKSAKRLDMEVQQELLQQVVQAFQYASQIFDDMPPVANDD